MTAVLPYIQIILAALLVGAILLQQSDASLGGAFGGQDSNWNAAYHSRRGFEKVSFEITIVLAVLFAAASLAALFL